MIMTTLEAMAAVFEDACAEGKKVSEQNSVEIMLASEVKLCDSDT